LIFVFDDFERSNISISELSGYLSNIIDGGDAKVLIIANEEEIKNKDEFKKIKEKIIGKTISLENCVELFLDHKENLTKIEKI
jgi:hypothetical protein